MITWYLRDRMISKKKNESNVNPTISYERHYALNWVRKFSDIDERDEVQTPRHILEKKRSCYTLFLLDLIRYLVSPF